MAHHTKWRIGGQAIGASYDMVEIDILFFYNFIPNFSLLISFLLMEKDRTENCKNIQ